MKARELRLVVLAMVFSGLSAATPAEAAAQDDPGFATADELEAAVRSADGVVRLAFDARPGVWGNGRSMTMTREGDGAPSGHCRGCTNGPVRVTLWVDGGRVSRLDGQVGGDWKVEGRDIGHVEAAIATDYLLGLVERGAGDVDSREEALQAAMVADADGAWPRLLAVARDRSEAADVRKAALFWTAQAAGDRAASEIEEIAVATDEETDVQEAAVFALTQLPEAQGTDALLRLARQNRNPAIVQSVYFWLGQQDDPRVIALFEEVLLD